MEYKNAVRASLVQIGCRQGFTEDLICYKTIRMYWLVLVDGRNVAG